MSKRKYYIPVSWEVWDKVEIQAESLEDAVKYVKENIDDIPLGTEPEYIDGSYKIEDGENGEASIEDTIEYIRDYWSAGNEEY